MKENSPLIIYDCDGVLEFSLVYGYALEKQKNKALTLSEFRAQHPNEKKVMAPGMDNLVRYTARVGNNVLLSGGNPIEEGSRALKNLFGYFQNWTYDGEMVPFGREPETAKKDNPRVAEELLQHFRPSMIIVIGDSEDECRLAQHIHADALILQGANKQSLLSTVTDVPCRHEVRDCEEMMSVLTEILSKPPQRKRGRVPHRLSWRSAKREGR